MKKYLVLISAAVAVSAPAEIISVNITKSGESDVTGSYGVVAEGSVATNWNNLTGDATGLLFDDGSSSSVNLTVVKGPSYNQAYPSEYAGTPLGVGIQENLSQSPHSSMTFSGLDAAFVSGYKAIVYLTGSSLCNAASVTDGATTYYYKTLWTSSNFDGTLTQTLDEDYVDGDATSVPVAQYAVFGSDESPLTGDTLTIEIDALLNNAAAIGGVQIVGVTAVFTNTMYVSSTDGNNTNDGLSESSPKANLNGLEGITFGSGAQILFKRGDVISGAFTLLGSGASNNPIRISAYGDLEKPQLIGSWDKRAVIFMTDNEWVEFSDLQISNFNTNNATYNNRYGVCIEPPDNAGEMRHIYFDGVDFSSIQGYDGAESAEDQHNSVAIYAVTVNNDAADTPSRWNGFVIENCTFADIDGRGAQIRDFCLDLADARIRATDFYPTLGLVFQNNYGTNCYRNLLQIRGTQDALIQYNVMDTTVEGSAVWPFASKDTVIQFNEFRHLRAHDTDAFACHFDYNCIGTLMQYNFCYDIEGGLIEIIALSQYEGAFQEGAVARYNIGLDVGYRDNDSAGGILLGGGVSGAKVYNNTIITLSQPVYRGITITQAADIWPTNCAIYNNLFYSNDTEPTNISLYRLTVNENLLTHNMYSGNFSKPYWAMQSPVVGDPAFVNAAGLTVDDFRVRSTSDAIGAGTLAADNGGQDYFSNTVSAVDAPTIGFHEYQTDGTIDSDGDLMVDMWESEYGLDPADSSDALTSADADRFSNLYEFCIGGNPTNGADIGYQPFYLIDGDRFVYVYPQRTDAQSLGLNYNLASTTNLISGPWVETVYQVDGVGADAFGSGFNAVTNSFLIDSSSNQQFIRLSFSAQDD